MRKFFGLLFVAALLVGVTGYFFGDRLIPKGGLETSMQLASPLKPFSVFSVGGDFAESGAVSAVFRQSDGTVLVQPALTVSADRAEFMVPPVIDMDGESHADNVGISIVSVLVDETTGKATVRTSDETTGIYIAGLPEADADFPSGARTLVHLASAIDAMDAALAAVPKDNKDLRANLTEYRKALDGFRTQVKKVVKDQKATGTVTAGGDKLTFGAEDLAKTDRLLVAIDSAADEVAMARSGWRGRLIPAARAETLSSCRQAAQDLGMEALLESHCAYQESVRAQAEKAGEVLPEAARFVYGTTFTMALRPMGVLTAGLSLWERVAVSTGVSYLVGAALEPFEGGKGLVGPAFESPIDALLAFIDEKSELPLSDVVPFGKLLYSVHEAMGASADRQPVQAVVAGAGKEIRHLEVTGDSVEVREMELPRERKTVKDIAAPMTQGNFAAATEDEPPAVAAPVTKKQSVKAAPTGTGSNDGVKCNGVVWNPCPAGQEFYCPPSGGDATCHPPSHKFCNGQWWAPCEDSSTEWVCTSSGAICQYKETTPPAGSGSDVAPAPVVEPSPQEQTGTISVLSGNCSYQGQSQVSAFDLVYLYEFQVSGTASGGVGWRVHLFSTKEVPGFQMTCGSWTNQGGECVRGAGQPESTTWNVRYPVQWYEGPGKYSEGQSFALQADYGVEYGVVRPRYLCQ